MGRQSSQQCMQPAKHDEHRYKKRPIPSENERLHARTIVSDAKTSEKTEPALPLLSLFGGAKKPPPPPPPHAASCERRSIKLAKRRFDMKLSSMRDPRFCIRLCNCDKSPFEQRLPCDRDMLMPSLVKLAQSLENLTKATNWHCLQ